MVDYKIFMTEDEQTETAALQKIKADEAKAKFDAKLQEVKEKGDRALEFLAASGNAVLLGVKEVIEGMDFTKHDEANFKETIAQAIENTIATGKGNQGLAKISTYFVTSFPNTQVTEVVTRLNFKYLGTDLKKLENEIINNKLANVADATGRLREISLRYAKKLDSELQSDIKTKLLRGLAA